MVSDVSRWGRFQNADHGAHLEFLCSRADIVVHYCAEQFENDGSIGSNLLKTVKRVMAGEYSRELSVKVFAGQCRLVEKGFRQGGMAGYGLRRLLIDENGEPKAELSIGERKSLQTDRVILVPGPPEEVEVVRRIYRLFVELGVQEAQIASLLNREGIATNLGRPWTRGTVHQVLTNPKYIGDNVFNRVSFKLKMRRVVNAQEHWVRARGVFTAIVDVVTFERAAKIVEDRSRRMSDADLLDLLRSLLAAQGSLSSLVIDEREDMPSSSVYRNRFGSLLRAYHLVGDSPRRDYRYIEINRRLRAMHPDVGAMECLVMSLVENCARRQHRSVDLLQDVATLRKRGYTDRQIGEKIGTSPEWVNMMATLIEKGEQRLVEAVDTGTIPISVAIEIARADDEAIQQMMAEAYTEGRISAPRLIKMRRLIEQRTRRGKYMPTNPFGKKLSKVRTSEAFEADVDRRASRPRLRAAETGRLAHEARRPQVDHWLADRDGKVKPNTLAVYKVVVEDIRGPCFDGPAKDKLAWKVSGKLPKGCRLVLMLGEIKTSELTTARIRAWHRELTALSGQYTANRAKSHLISILALDEEDYRVRAPSMPHGLGRNRVKAKKVILTPAEVGKLVEADRGDPEHGLYYAFPFLAGTRPSEQLGLLWDDVDFDANVIRICRIQERDGSLTNMTKTEARTRDIPMSAILRALLLEWRVRCPRLGKQLHRVFPGPGRLQPWPKVARIGGRGARRLQP